jgi:hypothetical protein
MKTNLAYPFGLGLALISAAPVALAQAAPDQMPPEQGGAGGGYHHGGGGQRGFDAMDTNHDGFVTLDEWKAAGRSEARFAEIDVNHTGKITRDDLRAYMQKMRAQRQQNGGNWGGGQNDGH